MKNQVSTVLFLIWAWVGIAQVPGMLGVNSGAAAQGTNSASQPVLPDLPRRLSEARAMLANVSGATNLPPGVPLEEGWTRRAAASRLVRLYEQQIDNLKVIEKARVARRDVEREAQSWTRFDESPPYSVLLTDRLRQEIQLERGRIRAIEFSMAMLEKMMAESRGALTEAEGAIRRHNEGLESTGDPQIAARLTWQRDLESLRSQAAAASIALFDQHLKISQETLSGSKARQALLERQLAIAGGNSSFVQSDLEKINARLERQRIQLEAELAAVQARKPEGSSALESARAQLRQAASGDQSEALEQVALREAQAELIDTGAYVLRLLLEVVNVERTMWQFRFLSHETASVGMLRDSERRLDDFSRRIRTWHGAARQQAESCSTQLRFQESRINELPGDSPLLGLVGERIQVLRDREAMLQRLLRGQEDVLYLAERWEEGLRDARSRLPIMGRLQTLFFDTRSFLERLWDFEVFTAEDVITVDGQTVTGKRSVTVGKILKALVILVIGYWLTGRATTFLERLMLRRTWMEPNQANLIRRWLRSFLVVCLVLFSLVSVKIPLTVFAFLGGALAIGLGFGTQTLLKNFVSGLILLFERPFRVGDVLDVGGQQGIITSVGLRASVLQKWDGTETLIPNSSLLENNVTNWTYTNRRVRFGVSVGVAYSSDPRRVMELMAAAAERHGLVEKEPKPQVLFTDFADSTLNFELRFWVDVGKANSAQVTSDLRLMIAGAFSENGIEIDYPQRDVHFHAGQPIDVRLVSGQPGAAEPGCGNRAGSVPPEIQ